MVFHLFLPSTIIPAISAGVLPFSNFVDTFMRLVGLGYVIIAIIKK